MGRRLLTRALLIAGLAVACSSPTLPLPPPSLPSFFASTTTPNSYHLSSDKGAIPNALVLTINRDTNLTPQQRVTGTIADAEGTWQMDVYAKPGDILDLTQNNGVEGSPDTEVDIPE